MIFIASVQLLLIYFNSTLEIAPMVEMFLSQLPAQFTDSFGDDILSQISVEGTIAFGLEHPIVITLTTFISFSMISRNIGSNSDNRIMEIILAHPFDRKVLISVLYVFTLFILVILTLSASFGATLAIYLFHKLDPELMTKMMIVDFNSFLLHAFIMSYALFFSVWFKDIAKAVRVSALIAFVFYFINIISDFWDSLAFTKYFNFFSYFNPEKIMVGYDRTGLEMAILAICTAILFVSSFRIFNRKDIS